MISVLSLFIFCGPKQDEVERIMEDGVEVVINHLEPYKIKGESNILNLEEEFIIDLEEESLAKAGIAEVGGFGVDGDGNIFFWNFESTEKFVFKFNKNGEYVESFGHFGQGPGEMEHVNHFRINEQNEIIVSDNNQKKLIVFSPDGDFVNELPIAPNHFIATLLENGKILAMKSIFKPEEGITESPIVLCDEDLKDVEVLNQGQKLPNWVRAKKINGIGIYTNYYPWNIVKGNIYIGNVGDEYEFLVFDQDGNLQKKIRKEYNPVKVPNEIKEKVIDMFKNHPVLIQMNIDVMDKVYFPDNMPPFQYFFTDDEGRLYVMTYEKGEGPRDFIYDIFNQEGFFTDRISLDNSGNENYVVWGGPFVAKAKNERLYCMREKESGYKELMVYKMNWH